MDLEKETERENLCHRILLLLRYANDERQIFIVSATFCLFSSFYKIIIRVLGKRMRKGRAFPPPPYKPPPPPPLNVSHSPSLSLSLWMKWNKGHYWHYLEYSQIKLRIFDEEFPCSPKKQSSSTSSWGDVFTKRRGCRTTVTFEILK